MQNIDINTLMPYITTLAAIIMPVATAYISAKSAEKTKKLDLHHPQAFAALNEFIEAYSNLDADKDSYSYVENSNGYGTDVSYKNFVVATHKLIPFISDSSLQSEICVFISNILAAGRQSTPQSDDAFDYLVIKIGACLAGSKPKTNKRKKHKVRHSKDY